MCSKNELGLIDNGHDAQGRDSGLSGKQKRSRKIVARLFFVLNKASARVGIKGGRFERHCEISYPQRNRFPQPNLWSELTTSLGISIIGCTATSSAALTTVFEAQSTPPPHR